MQMWETGPRCTAESERILIIIFMGNCVSFVDFMSVLMTLVGSQPARKIENVHESIILLLGLSFLFL